MTLPTMYGVSCDGAYTDVSKSERGAKRYATQHGYDTVYKRPSCGYHVFAVAEKKNGKWHSV